MAMFLLICRTSDMIVAPDLVNDVKDYLRDKKIDFKVLISDIQVKINICFVSSAYINIKSFEVLGSVHACKLIFVLIRELYVDDTNINNWKTVNDILWLNN